MRLLSALLAASLFSPAIVSAADCPGAAQDLITVSTVGEGADVVLIPGLASSPSVWSELEKSLTPGHRIHRVQIAGFAGAAPSASASEQVVAPAAEAIAGYICRQGLQQPAIIGHSLGGEIALMLAARHPELPGRLVIVDALPFYSLLFNPHATPEMVKPQAAAFRDAMLATPRDRAEAVQRASFANLVKTASAREALVQDGLRSDPKTVARATYEMMITDLRPELPRIKAPVDVVYAYDAAYGLLPAAVDARFTQAYAAAPSFRLHRVDNSFHFIMIDQPQQLAAIVQEALRQSPR